MQPLLHLLVVRLSQAPNAIVSRYDIRVGSFPLPVTVLKGALLRGLL